MKKAIVIPSFRAANTLASVLERLPASLWERGDIAIIVNDCSPDNTGEVAEALAQKYPGVIAVHHPQNRGYGGALKSGLQRGLEEGAEIFPIVHSDGQYAPEMVEKLCRPIEQRRSMIVQGSRLIGGGAREGGMPWVRLLPNMILTQLENWAFGTEMAEFHSGYMIFSRELLERIPFHELQDNYNFDAEMIIMAHLLEARCAEIPIPTRYDDEVSSLKPIPYGLNVLRMIARFQWGHYQELLDHFQQRDRAMALLPA